MPACWEAFSTLHRTCTLLLLRTRAAEPGVWGKCFYTRRVLLPLPPALVMQLGLRRAALPEEPSPHLALPAAAHLKLRELLT